MSTSRCRRHKNKNITPPVQPRRDKCFYDCVRDTDLAVDLAVFMAVDLAVFMAVDLAVDLAVFMAA